MRLQHSSDAVSDIVLCVTFFTRLPIQAAVTQRSFAQALWAAPVAGALVGLVSGGVLLIALAAGLPSGAAALLGLVASVVLTGALHEDGAADMADGFAGRTVGDRLEIMRDSHIGSYGTLALILLVLARWSALAALAAAGAGTILLALLAAHAASRAVLPAFAARVPPASATGLSAGIGPIEANRAALALGLGLVTLLVLGFGFAVIATLLLAGIFLAMERLCRRQIGGQNGDVLGALQQICEATLLLTMATLLA